MADISQAVSSILSDSVQCLSSIIRFSMLFRIRCEVTENARISTRHDRKANAEGESLNLS